MYKLFNTIENQKSCNKFIIYWLLAIGYWQFILSGCKFADKTESTDILKASDNYLLGSMYLDEGDFERATGQFILAIQKEPKYVEAHGGLGTAYFLRGNSYCLKQDYDKCTEDHNLAIRTYLQALKLNKDFEYAYYGIGRVLFIRWQLEKNYTRAQQAIKYFETAYKLNNKRALTSYYLGLCYLADNKLSQAKTYLEKYLEKAPNAANAHIVKEFLKDIEGQYYDEKYTKILQELETEYIKSGDKK